MEHLAKQLNISDYSLSQTTLEQIFLKFTKEAVVGRRGTVSAPNGATKPDGRPGAFDTYV